MILGKHQHWLIVALMVALLEKMFVLFLSIQICMLMLGILVTPKTLPSCPLLLLEELLQHQSKLLLLCYPLMHTLVRILPSFVPANWNIMATMLITDAKPTMENSLSLQPAILWSLWPFKMDSHAFLPILSWMKNCSNFLQLFWLVAAYLATHLLLMMNTLPLFQCCQMLRTATLQLELNRVLIFGETFLITKVTPNEDMVFSHHLILRQLWPLLMHHCHLTLLQTNVLPIWNQQWTQFGQLPWWQSLQELWRRILPAFLLFWSQCSIWYHHSFPEHSLRAACYSTSSWTFTIDFCFPNHYYYKMGRQLSRMGRMQSYLLLKDLFLQFNAPTHKNYMFLHYMNGTYKFLASWLYLPSN